MTPGKLYHLTDKQVEILREAVPLWNDEFHPYTIGNTGIPESLNNPVIEFVDSKVEPDDITITVTFRYDDANDFVDQCNEIDQAIQDSYTGGCLSPDDDKLGMDYFFQISATINEALIEASERSFQEAQAALANPTLLIVLGQAFPEEDKE